MKQLSLMLVLVSMFTYSYAQTTEEVAANMKGKWTLNYPDKTREIFITEINGTNFKGYYDAGGKKNVSGEIKDAGDHYEIALADLENWDWAGIFTFYINKSSWSVKGFWSAPSKGIKKEYTAVNTNFSAYAAGLDGNTQVSETPSENIDPDETLLVAEGQEGKMAYNKGLDYFKAGKFEPAMGEFDAAIAADNGFAEAYFYRGQVKAKIDRWEDAIIDFSLSITNGFDDAEAYYHRGVANFMLEKYENAIKDFNTAIVKKPDYAYAYNDRGSAHRKLEDFKSAIEDYEKAIEIDPKLAICYNNLGTVYRLLEEYDDAILNYSLALRLDKEYYIAMNNRGSAKFEAGDYEEAIEDFNKAIEMNEDYAYAYNNIACVLIKMEKFKEAVDILDKAIAIDENYGYAYLNRGIAKENLRDEEGACQDWTKARELKIKKAVSYLFQCDN